MRNLLKRGMSLLLVVVMVLSLAVPSVLAVAGTGDPDEGEKVTYQFYQEQYKGNMLTHYSWATVNADIAAAYDTLKWKPETTASYAQIDGSNPFVYLLLGESNAYAMRLQSPGAGTYDVTLNYYTNTHASAAPEGTMYIIEAPATFGEYASANLRTMTASMTPVVTVSYAASQTAAASAAGAYTFEANKEYLAVFCFSDGVDGVNSSLRGYINSLEVQKKPVNPGQAQPAEYDFMYLNNNEFLRDHADAIAAAYDTLNWKFFLTDNDYGYSRSTMFNKNVNALEMQNTAGSWFAFQIKSPGAGEYELVLEHGARPRGASVGRIYILPATESFNTVAEIDAAVGNHNTEGTQAYAGTANWYSSTENTTGVRSNAFRYNFQAGKEYVLVFKSQVKSLENANAFMYATKLTATPVVPEETTAPQETTAAQETTVPQETTSPDETTVPEETVPEATVPEGYDAAYDFMFKNDGTKLVDSAAAIAANYDQLKWKFYMTSFQYGYDGIRDGAAVGPGTIFNKNTNSLEMPSAAGQWFAYQIQAPGAGWYEITLEHGARPRGAAEVGLYILPATVDYNTVDEIKAAIADGTAKTLTVADMCSEEENQKGILSDKFYYEFEAGKDYIFVLRSQKKADTNSNAYLYASKLLMKQTEKPADDILNPPEPPKNFVTKDNTYVLYQPDYAGSYLTHYRAEGDTQLNGAKIYTDKFLAAYNTLKWKPETTDAIANITESGYLELTLGEKNYYAFRVQAPADGIYKVTLNHGVTANSNAAKSGNVYIFQATMDSYPGSMLSSAIKEQKPVLTTSYRSDKAGTASASGEFTFYAGKEYVVAFSVSDGVENNTATLHAYLNDITLTKIAEAPVDPMKDTSVYNLYLPEFAGQYLNHFREEGDPNLNGAQVVTEEVAAAFDKNGWKLENASSYSLFTKNNPYLEVVTGEANSFSVRIQSPGTGKYDVTLKHCLRNHAQAATSGKIYIFPAEKDLYTKAEINQVILKREPIAVANFKDPNTTGYSTSEITGSYSFTEGKDYIVVFVLADDDYAKTGIVRAFLSQLITKRVGEAIPNPGESDTAAGGTVYQLYMEQYSGKYLWHSTAENVRNEIAYNYDNGSQNWKYEYVSGSANFADGYLNVGMGKAGTFFGIRIKSPGTGTYQLTLEHFLNSHVRAAQIGEVYIIEAPETQYETYNEMSYAFARAPIITMTYELKDASGMKFTSCTGTYAFQEGKEYIIGFYGNDAADTTNEVSTTYIYLDRLIAKRIGEYAEPDAGERMPTGVVVNPAVANQFKSGVHGALTEVDGVNYLAVPTYGKRMYIYNLDAWTQVDEVYTGVGNPRGTTVDDEGNIWVTGDGGGIFKYDIRTGVGEIFKYTGSSLSSFYAANVGSDGRIYLGSGGTGVVAGFDPSNNTWFDLGKPLPEGKTVGAVNERDGIVYAAVHGDSTHYIVKLDGKTGELLGKLDVSARMYNIRYLTNLDFLGDYVVGCGANHNMGMMVVDPETMTFVSGEDFGIEANINRAVSEVVDGKQYFTTTTYGLCEFDLETKKATPLGGEFEKVTTGLRFTGKNFISGMEDLSDKTILTYGNPDTGGLMFWDLESGKTKTRENLVIPGSGEGAGLRSLCNGKPGSGELYMGCYDSNNVWVVDTATGDMVRTYATTGSQVDSMLWVDGTLYAGNYNTCTLTKVDFAGGKSQALFRLNDDVFNQARIHTMTYGENKIFCGTTPDVYRHGGMLVWYDLETGLTWVAAGPNPDQVFYTEAPQFWTATEWTQEATGKVLQVEDFKTLFDADQDGDGVNESFAGTMAFQTIQNVVYKDGLIYATGSVHGGTSTTKRSDIEACIFVYDVAQRKVIATCELTKYISDLGRPEFIQSLALDPNSQETLFWGGVSETLFSMRFDPETLKFTVKEELSFAKTTYYANQSRAWFPRPIIFDEEGYLYVAFDRIGGLVKVNTKDTSDYTQLLKNFNSVLEIPTGITFGDDGQLYYLTAGYELRVLKLDPTEEEWAEAKVVQDMIDALPAPADITAEDYEAIKAARTAYMALATPNRGLLNNLKVLEKAEEMVLIAMIDALGEVTIDQEFILAEMRANYNAMSMDRRLKITNYDTMRMAERRMSELKAQRVEQMINAIGEVTLEKEQQIRDARAAFLKLTASEQFMVTNLDVLNAAEAVIAQLKAKQKAVEKVIEKIDSIGEVTLESEEAIMDARTAYDKLDDAQKVLVTNYDVLVAAEAKLAKLKSNAQLLPWIVSSGVVVIAAAVGIVFVIPASRSKILSIFKKKS